jgi:hypothetical protein
MTRDPRRIWATLRALDRLCPVEATASERLRLAVAFLDLPCSARTVVGAAYVIGALVGLGVATAMLFVSGQFRLVVALAAVTLGLLASHAVQVTPRLWATARRTSALGAAPDLVVRAVLSMRLTPTPERAAAFAARTGDGLLATTLASHVRQSEHTGAAGLSAFGDAWADLFPSLRRSVALVTAAGNAPARDREQLLDRALTVVLDGTQDLMQSFAAEVRTPATALYAFGVLLPTALVALLPAASAAGVVVTPLSVVLLYNLVLPGVLVATSAWLLARRPVAFPPPEISPDHPDVTNRSRQAPLAGVATAVVAAPLAWYLASPWGPFVAAVGLGLGVTLWLRQRSVVAQYDQIDAIETALPDALSLIGRRVANGRAVETAIEHAAAELDDEMGAVLSDGVTRQRQLQVGVREAFLGRHGALAAVPSPRVRGSIALLSLAVAEGRPAGVALLSLSEHLERLQTVEQEARHNLTNVTRTLRSTAALFAPLVAGATVALAEGIGGTDVLAGGESLSWLGAPVAVYVLLMAVLLSALSTGLTRGLDRSLVQYRAGRALVFATMAFLGSYALVGTLV